MQLACHVQKECPTAAGERGYDFATVVRLVRPSDAADLARILSQDRASVEQWVPRQPDDYYTTHGQRAAITALLEGHESGTCVPCTITVAGRIVGIVTLHDIRRDALPSAQIGYVVSERDSGRGHATAAVTQMCSTAFNELGLHLLCAGTMINNIASQRVLERNRFTRVAIAEHYARIGGDWRDAVWYERLRDTEVT